MSISNSLYLSFIGLLSMSACLASMSSPLRYSSTVLASLVNGLFLISPTAITALRTSFISLSPSGSLISPAIACNNAFCAATGIYSFQTFLMLSAPPLKMFCVTKSARSFFASGVILPSRP